jgi:hypothetical protein
MWIKGRGFACAHAAFLFSRGNPAFRDQLITFHGGVQQLGTIGPPMNFGGDHGHGHQQHSYPKRRLRSKTRSLECRPQIVATQSVEVAGLVMQWQRFYGGAPWRVRDAARDEASCLPVARALPADNHLWLRLTGLPVWEKFYDGPGSEGEYARDPVRGTEGVMSGWRMEDPQP